MYDWHHWALFLSAAVALNVAPGPDAVYILTRTVAHGRRVGIASSLGVCSGAFIHVLAAAFGLSAILATSATAFMVVKYVGAAYLVYLGWKALRSPGVAFAPAGAAEDRRVTPWSAYRQGVAIDVLNPKVAIFFMAFLPQFVDPALGHAAAQTVLLGLIVILVAIVWEAFLVLCASGMTGTLRRRPAIGAWLDRLVGVVLIGLGIRLALEEQA
ncbi:LysE family translocator [Arenibaculum sp.]|jgi:threonine/homoserine/homoserine lactone efflux protein|uniref:LysE family translocator n=1 Tax=Arenibaculum sp. TaxID=2865862 RepID=UPI002E11BA14|nr:LysE family translocator [Arenibaculum sp.]